MGVKELLLQNERKDLLRLTTAGSVDDGKSTLIGRLLYDSKTIFEDHLKSLEKDSARVGSAGGEIDYSLLLDGLKAEREQGITIDVAYRYFSTPKRKFIIADTPGHEQYTRNMATGASTANLAIILVDAKHGVLPQTKRHSFIASLLRIKHIVIAVNKMDLVDYSQDVFDSIRATYSDFAARLDIQDAHFIPMSALRGDNVVEPSANMPWYHGGPLLDYLETVHIASDQNLVDLRFPVQYVLRPDLNFRGFCGTVASGIVRPGDLVMALPSGRKTRVKAIVTADGDLEEAFPPYAVTLTLEDELDISRGDMLTHTRNLPAIDNKLEAMLVWMSEARLETGKKYLLKQTTHTVPCAITACHYRIDVNTSRQQPADGLGLNEIGRVAIETTRPIFFDPYSRNRATGSFVIIDLMSNVTVAAGMILDQKPNPLLATEPQAKAKPAVKARKSQVSPEARLKRQGHRPATVWLTGLPKSGKSTIAYALEKRLFDQGCLVNVLDGENLRLGLSANLDFSGDGRSENNRRAAAVAKLFNDNGFITVAALVSPYESDRRNARELVGGDFVLVHLDTPLEVCEQRDDEGLYAKAKQGELKFFSGVSAPYEPPERTDLVVPSGAAVDAAVDAIVAELKRRGVLP